MSENEMSQQERDAADIHEMRSLRIIILNNLVRIQGEWEETWNRMTRRLPVAFDAAVRENQRLTVERDRLRAENERLRAAVEDVPNRLDMDAYRMESKYKGTSLHDSDLIDWLRAKAQALRAALASAERDGAGTAAGDATAGDGESVCPFCGGSGEVETIDHDYLGCSHCNGAGTVKVTR